MDNVININNKDINEYHTLIKERNFDELITIGIHKVEDGTYYEVLPSQETALEGLLGVLHIAADVIKDGRQLNE